MSSLSTGSILFGSSRGVIEKLYDIALIDVPVTVFIPEFNVTVTVSPGANISSGMNKIVFPSSDNIILPP